MKKYSRLLIISLVIILLSTVVLYGLNSSWGKIKVSNVYFPDQQGNLLHGVLYKPKEVDFANPAPAVITVHGGNGYMGMMSNVTLEMARRGYVVLAVDCNGSGWSDYTPTDVSTKMVDAHGNPLQGLENDGGVSRALAYLQNCDFVKEDNIVLIGHSQGGTFSFNAAFANLGNAKGVMVIASGGFAMRLSSLKPEDLHFNLSYIVSGYDEWISAIMGVDKTSELLEKDFMISAVGSDGPVVANKIYGSFAENNARVVYTTNTSHSGNLLNFDAIGKMLEFADLSVGQVNDIPYRNQVFWLKEIVSIIGVIGFELFLISLAICLSKTKYFSNIVSSESRPVIGVSKGIKALALIIAGILPLVLYYPIGLNSKANQVMPFRWANAFSFWAAASGLLILIAFIIWHFVNGKKNGGNIVTYGISTSTTEAKWDISYVLKSLLLALMVVGSGYIIVYLIYHIVPVEFGYWFFGIKPIPMLRVKYFPIYFLFFLVSALILTMVNITFTYSGSEETKAGILKQYIVPMAVTIGGLAVVMFIFYITLRVSGHTTLMPKKALDSVTLGDSYPLIPNFMVASLVSTGIYRKTRNTYLAAFVTALIITALTICTNSFSI